MSVEVRKVEVKPAVPAVVEERFVLTLTREEAEFMLRAVGAHPIAHLPAKMAMQTWDELNAAIGGTLTKYGKVHFTAPCPR